MTTSAEDTLTSKISMEKESLKDNIHIKAFYADNGVFKSKEFLEHLMMKHQSITDSKESPYKEDPQQIDFCGVGAHHQNGIP